MKESRPISWTERRWNPIVGCSKISDGCENCWAEKLARFHYHKDFPTGWDNHVLLFPDRLAQPSKWKNFSLCAVGLMGDLFHDQVPMEYIHQVINAAVGAKPNIFQFLTKRPARMKEAFESWIAESPLDISPGLASQSIFRNIWLGVSVEDQAAADERIPILLSIQGAGFLFVSLEPLLELVHLRSIRPPNVMEIDVLTGISVYYEDRQRIKGNKIGLVIVGGEAGGPRARMTQPYWIRLVRDDCLSAGTSFHFKQWGEWLPAGQRSYEYTIATAVDRRIGRKRSGCILDGQEWPFLIPPGFSNV